VILVGDCASDPPLGATARALAVERADDVVYGLGLLALARDGEKRPTELILLVRHDDAETALREAIARSEANVELRRVPDAWPARLPASTIEASALVHAADLARGRADRVYLTVAGAVASPSVMAVPAATTAEELVARAGGAIDDDWVAIAGGAPSGRIVPRDTPVEQLGALLLVLSARHEWARRLRATTADWLLRAASACEGCRVCTDSCPDEVPAHEVVWTLATARDDGTQLARAAGCTGCGLCDAMCPSALSPLRLVTEVRDRLNLSPPARDPAGPLHRGLDLSLLTLRLGLGDQVPAVPRIV
jgi:ferredoxin